MVQQSVHCFTGAMLLPIGHGLAHDSVSPRVQNTERWIGRLVRAVALLAVLFLISVLVVWWLLV